MPIDNTIRKARKRKGYSPWGLQKCIPMGSSTKESDEWVCLGCGKRWSNSIYFSKFRELYIKSISLYCVNLSKQRKQRKWIIEIFHLLWWKKKQLGNKTMLLWINQASQNITQNIMFFPFSYLVMDFVHSMSSKNDILINFKPLFYIWVFEDLEIHTLSRAVICKEMKNSVMGTWWMVALLQS